MLPLIALGLGFIGGIAVATFWDEITNWLENLVSKLADVIGILFKGAAEIVGTIIGTMAAIIHRLFRYEEEEDQWYEETTTRKIDKDKVPARIKNKLRANRETNIEMELGITA